MAESEAVRIALMALEESKKALAAGLYNSAVEEADRAVEVLLRGWAFKLGVRLSPEADYTLR